MQTLHIIVTGQVQGVGFRYFTQRTARDLGVFGVVRNCIDGSVEIYAQGDVDAFAEPEYTSERSGG